MSATNREPLKIGVASPLRNDPELFQAVEQATRYLDDLIDKHHLNPAKRELTWGAYPNSPDDSVLASLNESDRYGSRQAHRVLSRKRLMDPVARDTAMIQLLQDVLRQRWYQVGEVIDRDIRDLEKEEVNG